jgi:hypothetical protein
LSIREVFHEAAEGIKGPSGSSYLTIEQKMQCAHACEARLVRDAQKYFKKQTELALTK